MKDTLPIINMCNDQVLLTQNGFAQILDNNLTTEKFEK